MQRSHLPRLIVSAALLGAPAGRAGAELLADPTSYANCRISALTGFTDTLGPAVIGGGPGEKTVGFSVEKMETIGPILEYLGVLQYDCFVFGAGAARYGSLSGRIESTTDASPETLEPAPGSGRDPRSNDGYARADARMQVGFRDSGTVTSSLPDGTPVTLEFVFDLHALPFAAGRPPGPDLGVGFAYTVDVRDLSAFDPVTGYPTLHRVLFAPGSSTASFDTAVGHELDIEAALGLSSVAHAGRDVGGAGPFYPHVEALIDAEHTAELTLDAPDGVAFEADSGHDYSVAAPEPSEGLLLATGALLLIALHQRRRQIARGAATPPGGRVYDPGPDPRSPTWLVLDPG
jgi:MYXO-CTERM domain-containing protein